MSSVLYFQCTAYNIPRACIDYSSLCLFVNLMIKQPNKRISDSVKINVSIALK